MPGETRGFLTADDRAYLKGDKEYTSEGTEFNTRRRIRRRARQGFVDFALLFRHMNENDRKQVFKNDQGIRPDLGDPIRDTIAFIFEGYGGLPHLAGSTHVPDYWGDVLEAGVEYAGLRHDYHVRGIEFSIDAQKVSLKQARNKLEGGGRNLTAGEIKVLYDAGEIEITPTD